MDEYTAETITTFIDNNEFSAAFYPVDVHQTADGGYIVLAEKKIPESTFRSVYLVRTDKFGKFQSDMELDETHVNPIGPLMLSDDKFYFFCMNPFNQEALLVSMDAELSALEENSAGGLTYPAVASLDGNLFLLQSYDQVNKNTVISKHAANGSISGQTLSLSIGVGEDVEEPIINHFLRTGKRFPFQVGHIAGGSYFFNGFFNYTFSLVFVDAGLQSEQGVVQGQQDDGGFSAVLPLGSGKFAASRFNFGDNYLLPNTTLSPTGTSTGIELGGNSMPELAANATVRILSANVKSKGILVFATDTRSKQIGLFFYDQATGEFLNSRYLGFSNPFEVGSITSTADGGLMVSGTTYLAGRFPRICLLKISKSELESLTN